MTLREAIDLVTGWLDVIHLESAPARVAEDLASFHRREAGTLHGTDTQSGSRGRVSLHEAAHAVAGHLWGATVSRVAVWSDGKGAVWSEHPPDAIGRVVELLAGPFSELFVGADRTRQFGLAHSSDILDAAVVIQSTSFDYRTAATIAAITVNGQWDAIFRVALALQECGELSGAEIAAFLAEPQ